MPRINNYRDVYLKRDLNNYIHNKMREYRITQKQMANELGISQSQFSKRLAKMTLTYEDLVIIFKVLKTPRQEIGTLLGGTKE